MWKAETADRAGSGDATSFAFDQFKAARKRFPRAKVISFRKLANGKTEVTPRYSATESRATDTLTGATHRMRKLRLLEIAAQL